mgnify:CR=1 FL=1
MTNWLLVTITLVAATLGFQTRAEDGINISSHTLASKVADSSLNFKVALPWGYDKNKPYPVLYTTAGGSRFDSFVHQVDWLSHVAMGPMPQFIIVNVPKVTVPSDMHPKFIAASGIANKLQLAVLAQEVMPYIEENYQTQGFNLLEGYSSNGNFVLHTYLEKPVLFDGYLAHSPALGLDKTHLVKKLTSLKPADLADQPPFYLSLGPFAENKPIFERIKASLRQSTNLQLEDFSQHNFLSVATISMNNGAEWLFSDLQPKVAQFAEGGSDAVTAYYHKLEHKYKKAMDASNTLIDLSFHYAEQGSKDKAVATINTLVEAHPNNVYYLTRRAAIHKQLGQTEASRQSLYQAEKLAAKANNEDAISYIKGELAKL